MADEAPRAVYPLRAVRAYITVESGGPVSFYTGKIVKTLLYTLLRELSLYRGLRGVLSPLHISPLFKPGRREWELGEVVTPYYARERGEAGEKLKPVELNGEYIIHIGGDHSLVTRAAKLLEEVRTPLQVKIGDSIIRFKLESLRDVTSDIEEKRANSDKVTVYLKAPTKLFNVYTKSKLPKFNVSAIEVLMAPYMFYTGQLTMDASLLLRASTILGNLVETYYSITTVKPLTIPYNNRKTPTLTGKITYIIETRDTETITRILQIAEITGVGQSRQNGFGTTTWR